MDCSIFEEYQFDLVQDNNHRVDIQQKTQTNGISRKRWEVGKRGLLSLDSQASFTSCSLSSNTSLAELESSVLQPVRRKRRNYEITYLVISTKPEKKFWKLKEDGSEEFEDRLGLRPRSVVFGKLLRRQMRIAGQKRFQRKNVSFLAEVEVFKVPNKRKFTTSVKKKIWYTAKEFERSVLLHCQLSSLGLIST
eukprot:snap_masked-scaffold_4-processed-gene-14.32-mRNA-1 protein AED:1.00 eAED:1.00 QI:0/-1/0/0/-1/1/1/0/192